MWISVDRDMPPIKEYCHISSGYQSVLVRVHLENGEELNAALQLYGNSTRGWNSEWWRDGMLSAEDIGSRVLCWYPLDAAEQQVYEGSGILQTIEEIRLKKNE